MSVDFGTYVNKLFFPFCLCYLQFVLQALGNMILVSITNHWLLVPTCVLLIAFCALRQIYIQTGRCVKRVESLCKFSCTRSVKYSYNQWCRQINNTKKVIDINTRKSQITGYAIVL